MRDHFISGGEDRYYDSPEFEVKLQELRESVRAKYVVEWEQAGLFYRLILRWRIAAEFRRERRKMEPSPYSLYGSRIVARD